MTNPVDGHFEPDNVDRMLIRVLEETLTVEPWRREQPVVIINDVTGATGQVINSLRCAASRIPPLWRPSRPH